MRFKNKNIMKNIFDCTMRSTHCIIIQREKERRNRCQCNAHWFAWCVGVRASPEPSNIVNYENRAAIILDVRSWPTTAVVAGYFRRRPIICAATIGCASRYWWTCNIHDNNWRQTIQMTSKLLISWLNIRSPAWRKKSRRTVLFMALCSRMYCSFTRMFSQRRQHESVAKL